MVSSQFCTKERVFSLHKVLAWKENGQLGPKLSTVVHLRARDFLFFLFLYFKIFTIGTYDSRGKIYAYIVKIHVWPSRLTSNRVLPLPFVRVPAGRPNP